MGGGVGPAGARCGGLAIGPEGKAPAEEDDLERKRVLEQWAPVVEGMAGASEMVAKALEEKTFEQSLSDVFWDIVLFWIVSFVVL